MPATDKMGATKRGRGRPPKHPPAPGRPPKHPPAPGRPPKHHPVPVPEKIHEIFSCPVFQKNFSSHEAMTALKKCHNLTPFVKIDRFVCTHLFLKVETQEVIY